MPPFLPLDQENGILAGLEQQRNAIANAQRTATPQLAFNASTIHRAYPWMHPEITYALAHQGFDATHPVVKAAAQTQIAQAIRDRGNLTPGQVVDPNAQGAVSRKAQKVRDRLVHYAENPFGDDPHGLQQHLIKQIQGMTDDHALLTTGNHLARQLDAAKKVADSGSGFDPAGLVGDVYNTATSWLPGNDPNINKDVPGLAQLHSGASTAASYAGAALQTGGQVVAGALRVGAGKDPFDPWTPTDIEHVGEQTTGGQLLKQLVQGDSVSVPQADVSAAQAARKFSPYLIDGHAWTLGRAASDFAGGDLGIKVFQPGELANTFLSGAVDAGVSWYTDPAAIGLKSLGKTAEAKQLFAGSRSTGGVLRGTEEARFEAGAVDGSQKAVISPTYEGWKVSDQGQHLVSKLTETKDPFTIYQRMSSHGMDVPLQDASGNSVFHTLAGTKTDQETIAYLDHLVKDTGDITKIPKWDAIGSSGQYVQPRYTGIVPGRDLDFNDPGSVWKTLDNQLVNAKATLEQRRGVFNTYVRDLSNQTNRAATLNAAGKVLETNMVAHGVEEGAAKNFASWAKKSYNDDRLYGVDQLGNNVDVPAFVNGGEAASLPHPGLMSEMLGDKVTLQWNYRDIRKATANPVIKMLVDNGAAKAATDLLDTSTQFWRVTHIMRPAIIFRTTGAAQVEIAAVGATSLANHPFKAIATIIGNHPEGVFSRRLNNIGEMMANHGLDNVPGVKNFVAGLKGSYTTTPGGVPLSSVHEAMDAFGQSFTSFRNEGKTLLDQWARVDRTHPEYARGWMTELAQLAADPVASKLPKFASEDQALEWFMRGEGKGLRMKLAQNPNYEILATDEDAARRYLQSVYERIATKTQGDRRLVDAVTTGRVNDHPIVDWVQTAQDEGRTSKGAIGQLKGIADEGIGPDVVKVPKQYAMSTTARSKVGQMYSRAEDWMYTHLLVNPNATTAAHPFVMQQAWHHMETEVFSHMTPEARAEVIRRFDSASLPKAVEARFRQLDGALTASEAKTGKAAGTLGLEQGDYMATKRALVDYKQVLHQLYDKSQIFDALRFLFPFGDAWRQMAQRWIKIAASQPQVVRRAQQLEQGAQGSGFLRTDPQTGEQVITYPGSELLTEKLTGVPIPMKFAAKDLNLLGEGLPGVGPAVSLGVPYIAKGLHDLGGPDLDKPEFNWLKQIIYPKGGEPTGEPVTDISNTLLPAWAQKVKTALFDDPNAVKAYGNTVADVARYLSTTGDYDLHGDNAAGETRRLWQDARSKAGWFYAVRGIAQALLPASPSPDFLVKDKTGQSVLAFKIIQEYHDREAKDGYQAAFDWLIKTHGDENFMLAQSKSKANIPNLPATGRAIDWEKTNAGVVEKFPNVWTFFSPLGGSFDQAAYQSQFTNNQRTSYTMQEMSDLANARLAASQYQHASEKYPVATRTPKQRVWLKQVDEYLVGHYPGYAGVNHQVDTFPLPPLIDELQRSVKDPQLGRTDTGKAIKTYLGYRQAVIDDSQAAGHASPWGVKSQEANIAWLNHKAEVLVKAHPGFGPVFDWVFSRETGGFTKGNTGG